MNIQTLLQNKIAEALKSLGVDIDASTIVIETSKEAIHGDFASNIAMQSAGKLKKPPRAIAEDIKNIINMDGLDKVEIAGPGFLNFFVAPSKLAEIISQINDEGAKFGESKIGEGQKINVEFVSANPTGDLHLGHARGAALGDAICRLYEACGYDVTREYYVNDAGAQIDNLAESLYVRYMELFGEQLELPKDGYAASDIIDIAKELKNEVGKKYVNNYSASFFKNYGIKKELEKINEDLKLFRVPFDVYTYETDI